MHPHLRHPPKPQHRRRFADNPGFILPRLHKPVPGHLPVQHNVEYSSEVLLHPLFALHLIPDAEGICPDEGEGEGMETRGLLFNRQCDRRPNIYDDFQGQVCLGLDGGMFYLPPIYILQLTHIHDTGFLDILPNP